MYNQIDKLVSAVKNDIVSGLQGFHTNLSMSDELLALDIVDERLLILKEYSLNGILPVRDLYISINCINVDCKNLEKCRCSNLGTPTLHFEIPQIVNDYGNLSIDYIGAVDKQLAFPYYTSPISFKYHKYRKRGKNKPCIWIDTTPNENGMYDCFIFNAPFLKTISISAIFKDLRLLDAYSCCTGLLDNNMSLIDTEVKNRVVLKKIKYYRLFATGVSPNNLKYT